MGVVTVAGTQLLSTRGVMSMTADGVDDARG
jgi:hypothetical protein